MTKNDMYDALLRTYGYRPRGYVPYDRYSEIIRKDSEFMNFNDAKILVDGHAYIPSDIRLNSDLNGTELTVSTYLDPRNRTTATISNCACRTPKIPTIENVIFNPPATIVFWSDKTKTIVKADYEYENYDPEKGIAMAIAKKLMGDNKGHYYELFKHWRKKWDEQNKSEDDIFTMLAKNIEKVFGVPCPVEPMNAKNVEENEDCGFLD